MTETLRMLVDGRWSGAERGETFAAGGQRAMAGTVLGCYLCAGQSCTAGERILVDEAVLRLGEPFDEATTPGPLEQMTDLETVVVDTED